MSTRANIGIVLDDGVILSVYVHHDGYPEHICPILKTCLKDKISIIEFLSGGDCSSIYNAYNYNNGTAYIDATYYRDENSKMRVDKNMEAYTESIKNSWYEFCYLFIDGEWKYTAVNRSEEEELLNFENLPEEN